MIPSNSPTSLHAFISRFQLQLPQARRSRTTMRPAAVLIPIVCRAEPTLLLTRRADSLRKHAGQVAFPGGKTDAEDGSAIVTALREAQEEVAIPPNAVTVLGKWRRSTAAPDFRSRPSSASSRRTCSSTPTRAKWRTCSRCPCGSADPVALLPAGYPSRRPHAPHLPLLVSQPVYLGADRSHYSPPGAAGQYLTRIA